MAKKNQSLLQAQPAVAAPGPTGLFYLVWALLSYLVLHGLWQLPVPLASHWTPLPFPIPAPLQQAADILRYLLPTLFIGLGLLSGMRRLGLDQTNRGNLSPTSALLLAAISWLLLDTLADSSAALMRPEYLNPLLSQPAVRLGLEIAQYAVPALCLLLMLLTRPRALKGSHLFEAVADPQGKKTLENISWREFEQLVGELFHRRGFRVAETQYGADGGVDLILHRQGKTYLVQCKQWKAFKVGVKVVRELYGVMAAEGAVGGYVVTSGRFTEQAYEFAKGLELYLIDGEALYQWIHEEIPNRAKQQDTPPCPECGAPMKKRTAKRGAHAGYTFWGCTRYPSCKGTRQG